jgi:hypothetical protein
VAHNAEGLDAGETVILTLKDRSILEEGDDDPEELEDVLAVRLLPPSWLHFERRHGNLLMRATATLRSWRMSLRPRLMLSNLTTQ